MGDEYQQMYFDAQVNKIEEEIIIRVSRKCKPYCFRAVFFWVNRAVKQYFRLFHIFFVNMTLQTINRAKSFVFSFNNERPSLFQQIKKKTKSNGHGNNVDNCTGPINLGPLQSLIL